jgi:hypothetical protein
MATLNIPRSAYDAAQAGAAPFDWAEGLYSGTIEQASVKALPSAANGDPFAGYETTDGERLTLKIGDIEPIDSALTKEQIGNRKYFDDIVLVDGSTTVFEVDVTARDAKNWQLQQSAIRIVSLAQALGEVTEDDGNMAVNDGFIDGLRADAYVGTRVGFKLTTRTKNGKTYATLKSYFDAEV